MAPTLQFSLGLTDLTLVSAMSAFGSTAGAMLQYAAQAIQSGQANVVACVYADAPLTEGGSISQSAYGGQRVNAPGFAGLRLAYGDYGPANSMYALALRRHMHLFGTTHDQLGTIAVGQREWALKNPRAQMRKPMTIDDYHASRWVVEPLHLFDCCLVSNGGVAVIVTSAERARDLRQPPVVPARLRPVRARAIRRGPGASRRSTPARRGPASWRCARRASSSPTSTSSSSTTATRTPSSSPSRTTASARRARAARSSPTAGSGRAASCPATPAAASSPRTTCGASRRCRRA